MVTLEGCTRALFSIAHGASPQSTWHGVQRLEYQQDLINKITIELTFNTSKSSYSEVASKHSGADTCRVILQCTSGSSTSILETWLFSFGGLMGLIVIGLGSFILIRRRHRRCVPVLRASRLPYFGDHPPLSVLQSTYARRANLDCKSSLLMSISF